jgi:hypothetical protein
MDLQKIMVKIIVNVHMEYIFQIKNYIIYKEFVIKLNIQIKLEN